MIDREKILKGLECCADLQRDTMHRACDVCPYNDDPRQGTCVTLFPLFRDALDVLKADQTYLQEQDKKVKKLEDEISELRETLTEMSMNGGTGNQHDVCKFLLKLMDVIEKRQRGEDCATD